MNNFKQFILKESHSEKLEDLYTKLKVTITSHPYNFTWKHEFIKGFKPNQLLAYRQDPLLPEILKIMTISIITVSADDVPISIDMPDDGMYDPTHDKLVCIDDSLLQSFYSEDNKFFGVDTRRMILNPKGPSIPISLYVNKIKPSFIQFEYFKTLNGTPAEKLVKYLEFNREEWKKQDIWDQQQDEELAKFKHVKNIPLTAADWSSLM